MKRICVQRIVLPVSMAAKDRKIVFNLSIHLELNPGKKLPVMNRSLQTSAGCFDCTVYSFAQLQVDFIG